MKYDRFVLSGYLGLILFFLTFVSADAYDRFEVKVVGGVPTILFDGVPARDRMFFGIPGADPIMVGKEFQNVQFDFCPTEDGMNRGTIHFRFGRMPGDIVMIEWLWRTVKYEEM